MMRYNHCILFSPGPQRNEGSLNVVNHPRLRDRLHALLFGEEHRLNIIVQGEKEVTLEQHEAAV